MPAFTYQVEWQDDEDRTHVKPYGERRYAAIAAARRQSSKHMVAYVVALKSRPDGGTVAVGHKSYGQGLVIETDGDGFQI